MAARAPPRSSAKRIKATSQPHCSWAAASAATSGSGWGTGVGGGVGAEPIGPRGNNEASQASSHPSGVSASSTILARVSHIVPSSSGRSTPTSSTAAAAGSTALLAASARSWRSVPNSAASWRDSAVPTNPATANTPTDAPSSVASGSKKGRTRASTSNMHTARTLNSARTSAGVSSETQIAPPRHHNPIPIAAGTKLWPNQTIRPEGPGSGTMDTKARASSARPMPVSRRQLGSRSSAT